MNDSTPGLLLCNPTRLLVSRCVDVSSVYPAPGQMYVGDSLVGCSPEYWCSALTEGDDWVVVEYERPVFAWGVRLRRYTGRRVARILALPPDGSAPMIVFEDDDPQSEQHPVYLFKNLPAYTSSLRIEFHRIGGWAGIYEAELLGHEFLPSPPTYVTDGVLSTHATAAPASSEIYAGYPRGNAVGDTRTSYWCSALTENDPNGCFLQLRFDDTASPLFPWALEVLPYQGRSPKRILVLSDDEEWIEAYYRDEIYDRARLDTFFRFDFDEMGAFQSREIRIEYDPNERGWAGIYTARLIGHPTIATPIPLIVGSNMFQGSNAREEALEFLFSSVSFTPDPDDEEEDGEELEDETPLSLLSDYRIRVTGPEGQIVILQTFRSLLHASGTKTDVLSDELVIRNHRLSAEFFEIGIDSHNWNRFLLGASDLKEMLQSDSTTLLWLLRLAEELGLKYLLLYYCSSLATAKVSTEQAARVFVEWFERLEQVPEEGSESPLQSVITFALFTRLKNDQVVARQSQARWLQLHLLYASLVEEEEEEQSSRTNNSTIQDYLLLPSALPSRNPKTLLSDHLSRALPVTNARLLSSWEASGDLNAGTSCLLEILLFSFSFFRSVLSFGGVELQHFRRTRELVVEGLTDLTMQMLVEFGYTQQIMGIGEKPLSDLLILFTHAEKYGEGEFAMYLFTALAQISPRTRESFDDEIAFCEELLAACPRGNDLRRIWGLEVLDDEED